MFLFLRSVIHIGGIHIGVIEKAWADPTGEIKITNNTVKKILLEE